jgi:hypothetical protein
VDRHHLNRRNRNADGPVAKDPATPAGAPGKSTRVQTEHAQGGASATGAHARGAQARASSQPTATTMPTGAMPAPVAGTLASGTQPPPMSGAAAKLAPQLAPPAIAVPTAATARTLTAPAGPASAPAGGGVIDGLIDPFMKARWDSTRFWTLVEQHGLPGHAPPEVMGELDRWLPLDLSPDARRAIHIAAAFTSGLVDDTVWKIAEKLPGIGPLVALLHGVTDVSERVAKYQALGDPVGALITATGGTVGVVKDLAERAVEPLGGITKACDLIDIAMTAVAIGSAPSGPPAVAAAAVKAITHPIAGAVGLVSDGATVAIAGISQVQRFFDVAEIAYDASRARGLEARAQFAHAAEYKGLIQDRASDVMFGSLKDMVDVAGVLAGTVAFPVSWIVPADFIIGEAFGAVGDAVATAEDLTGHLRDAVGTDTLAIDAVIPGLGFQLGDALRVDRPYLGPARPCGEPVLDAARDATVADAAAAQAAAIAARPEWHPELVAALIATPGFSFATAPDRMRPTWYVEQVARMLRLGATTGGAATADGIGTAIDAVGAGLQPAFDLAVVGTNRFLAANLPQLQQLVTGLDGELEKTRLDLAAARTVVGTLQTVVRTGRETLPALHAAAATVRDQMLGTLAGMKVDLPDLPGLDGLEAQLHAAIDAARETVIEVYASGIIPLEINMIRVIAQVERELAELQASIEVGGTVYAALDAQYQQVKTLAHEAATVFAKWQPVIPRIDVQGAGTWLRDLAGKWRTAVAIEQGVVPDPWAQQIVPQIAAPHVAQWKAAHAGQLEQAFHPAMPAGELAACAALRDRAAGAIARLDPDSAQIATAILASAYQRCVDQAGSRGRGALLALWSREDWLAQTVHQIEGWASTPQPVGPPPLPDDTAVPEATPTPTPAPTPDATPEPERTAP